MEIRDRMIIPLTCKQLKLTVFGLLLTGMFIGVIVHDLLFIGVISIMLVITFGVVQILVWAIDGKIKCRCDND